MKSLLISMITLLSAQVFAAGAMEYKCMGVSKASRTPIEFNVAFSDYERSVGFSNESITITKFHVSTSGLYSIARFFLLRSG